MHHGAAAHHEPPQQERAVHHGVRAPRVVLAPPAHAGRHLAGPQLPEARHAQRRGPRRVQRLVARPRLVHVLDALEAAQARLRPLVRQPRHVRVRLACPAVVAGRRVVGGGIRQGRLPPVVCARPCRRVVDAPPRVDGLGRLREVTRHDGDGGARWRLVLQAHGGGEADHAGAGSRLVRSGRGRGAADPITTMVWGIVAR